MITKEQIKDCKDACASQGYIIEDSDIAFLLLNREFKDASMAHSLVIGSGDVEEYDKSEKMTYLRKYMNENWVKKKRVLRETDVTNMVGEISFEDNRDALIQYLSDIEEMMADKKIDPKDAMKMMTDIRLKLNDKFNIKEQQVDQRIVVQPKFNYICEHTHKECWLQTKEYAMSHWHLVPDPSYKEQ